MARCPHSDIRQTPHLLRYHLLGVLCWLYPVGYPRISTGFLYRRVRPLLRERPFGYCGAFRGGAGPGGEDDGGRPARGSS